MTGGGEERDRLTRWRLVLGGDEADGVVAPDGSRIGLSADDQSRDRALSELYDGRRGAGLSRSSPRVARWLGDIRTYFPSSVVQVLQADAMERLGLRQLLLEPEMLRAVEPDLALVATLVGLGSAIPEESRQTARVGRPTRIAGQSIDFGSDLTLALGHAFRAPPGLLDLLLQPLAPPFPQPTARLLETLQRRDPLRQPLILAAGRCALHGVRRIPQPARGVLEARPSVFARQAFELPRQFLRLLGQFGPRVAPRSTGRLVGEIMKTHKGQVDAGDVKRVAEGLLKG